ncbi:hypothetical protein TEA_002804 [Camellia sinensis var. sinensis]|uniref:Uncharacterized protein n=1 Tax=Camellia sinensis var. sinensis TaxID=542762 RepID=A0A4S4DF23_CAMSN|nr:hypothetical protein TEA_002804 [Camellia sinensis var. sinensis]
MVMSVQWILVCHGLVTLLVVVSFLCGQWPIFRGTFIERIHYFLTFGAYDYFRRIVGVICGSRGTDALLSVEYYCCDRPNPILQSVFSYIPGYYLSEVHRLTSLLAVGVGILLFLLTSYSDPGTVNAENVSQYLSAYPYDNAIYLEKECSTCKILKVLSTDIDLLGPSTAAFAIAVSLGERNTRYFMAFLLWHFLLCIYGTVAIALVLAGRVKELKVVYILTVYYGIENSFRSLAPHVVQSCSVLPRTALSFVFRILVSSRSDSDAIKALEEQRIWSYGDGFGTMVMDLELWLSEL